MPVDQQTPQQAGAIASKHGIGAQDVLLGIKDPNKALVQINQNSPGERKDIAEARTQLDTLNNIDVLYDSTFVGPVDSRIGRVKSLTGTLKQQEAQFRAAVELQRTELRKFYFGTAQSKQELKGALDAIPDLNMTGPAFEAAQNETRRKVTSMLRRRAEVMQESGVRAPGAKPSLNERYKQLKQLDEQASDRDIFSVLEKEGYP